MWCVSAITPPVCVPDHANRIQPESVSCCFFVFQCCVTISDLKGRKKVVTRSIAFIVRVLLCRLHDSGIWTRKYRHLNYSKHKSRFRLYQDSLIRPEQISLTRACAVDSSSPEILLSYHCRVVKIWPNIAREEMWTYVGP